MSTRSNSTTRTTRSGKPTAPKNQALGGPSNSSASENSVPSASSSTGAPAVVPNTNSSNQDEFLLDGLAPTPTRPSYAEAATPTRQNRNFDDQRLRNIEEFLRNLNFDLASYRQETADVSSLVNEILQNTSNANNGSPPIASVPVPVPANSSYSNYAGPSTQTPIQNNSRGMEPISAKIELPQKFSGNQLESEEFLFSLQNYFTFCGALTLDQQIRIFISLLTGDALTWYRRVIFESKMTFHSFDDLLHEFRLRWSIDPFVLEESSKRQLHYLRQTSSVRQYADQFKRIAANTKFDDYSRTHFFQMGLKENVKHHIFQLNPRPASLNELISESIRFDEREFFLKQHVEKVPKPVYSAPHSYEKVSKPVYSAPQLTSTNPVRRDFRNSTNAMKHAEPKTTKVNAIEVTTTKKKPVHRPYGLSLEERNQRRDNNLCVYCGQSECPGVQETESCPLIPSKNGDAEVEEGR